MSLELMGWIMAGAVLLLVAGLLLWRRLRTKRNDRRAGRPRPKRRSGTSGSMGNAFLTMHALLEPDRRHVLEIRRQQTGDEDESGEPPEPGPAPPRR